MPGQTIDIPVSSVGKFTGYLATPPGGTGPGLILLQEIFGINQGIRMAADLFAEEGYVVLAPDLFWRIEPGIELGYEGQDRQKAMECFGKFDVDQGLQDIGAALQTLRDRPECQRGVAAMGYCLGGLLAYLTAARHEVDAAIGFYGVRIDRYLDEAKNIRCPLMLHFGEKDDHVPAEDVAKIQEACKDRQDVAIYVYPDAGHGFYLPVRSSFHGPSSLMSHSRTIALLRRRLGPEFDLNALWDRHVVLEFADRDADQTMKTMVAEPYVNHVPTMTGGVGFKNLHHFYKHHFIPKLPADTKLIPLSRTIGADRLIEELIFCFTHDKEIDWLLPGVAPTGKYVEVPLVAVVRFRGDKLYNEHIYWDQASVLVQIGLLNPKGLPVAGIETARKMVDESLPSNTLMKRWIGPQ